MSDAQYKECTVKIKALADVRKLSIEDTDIIINNFFEGLKERDGTERELLGGMTNEEKKEFARKEVELKEGKEEMQQEVNGAT